MKFHFGGISKQPNILMDMCRHFISGSVYMIFYHTKWNFISVEMTDMKSIPALTFKCTCTVNATSNECALIHFLHGKLCSHENLMPVSNFILVKWQIWNPYHFEFHFTSIHVNTNKELTGHRSGIFNRNEISYRFELVSPLMWTYFKKVYSPWNHQKPLDFFNQICIVLRSKIWQPSRFKVLIRETKQH